jgi:hypothetical protein
MEILAAPAKSLSPRQGILRRLPTHRDGTKMTPGSDITNSTSGGGAPATVFGRVAGRDVWEEVIVRGSDRKHTRHARNAGDAPCQPTHLLRKARRFARQAPHITREAWNRGGKATNSDSKPHNPARVAKSLVRRAPGLALKAKSPSLQASQSRARGLEPHAQGADPRAE